MALKSRRVLVTPAMAKEWADRPTINRPISPATVREYRSIMEAGRWVADIDQVWLWPNGGVANAHHSLQAQYEAGLTLWWDVVDNVTPEMVDAKDCGRARSISDRLSIDGVARHSEVASRMGIVLRIENGVRSTMKSAKHEIDGARLRFSEPLEWSLVTLPKKTGLRAPYVGALIYAYRTNPDVISKFAESVKTGEMLTRGDPAYAMRSYIEAHGAGGAGQLAAAEHIVVTLRALKGAIEGERIFQLKPTLLIGAALASLVEYFAVANRRREELPRRRVG